MNHDLRLVTGELFQVRAAPARAVVNPPPDMVRRSSPATSRLAAAKASQRRSAVQEMILAALRAAGPQTHEGLCRQPTLAVYPPSSIRGRTHDLVRAGRVCAVGTVLNARRNSCTVWAAATEGRSPT